ncbi:MAG: hypothetical protein V2I33_18770 [Kangiellaceae bacterium]|jgi:hypothetical protein|nr:hypothetical protein [Kangiellaceae bacterium]
MELSGNSDKRMRGLSRSVQNAKYGQVRAGKKERRVKSRQKGRRKTGNMKRNRSGEWSQAEAKSPTKRLKIDQE